LSQVVATALVADGVKVFCGLDDGQVVRCMLSESEIRTKNLDSKNAITSMVLSSDRSLVIVARRDCKVVSAMDVDSLRGVWEYACLDSVGPLVCKGSNVFVGVEDNCIMSLQQGSGCWSGQFGSMSCGPMLGMSAL
jgi:hypothetical protein